MKPTQHAVPHFGDVLDRLRRGERTILDSFEFDMTVGSPDGEFVLEIGHPSDVRKLPAQSRATTADWFFDRLELLEINRLVVHIQPRHWDAAQKKAVFRAGEREFLLAEADRLFRSYLANTGEATPTELIISSGDAELFADIKQQKLWKDESRIKKQYYVRDITRNAFAEPRELGVEEVVFQFPATNTETQLQALQDQAAQPENRQFVISFYPNSMAEYVEAECLDILQRYFPDAGIVLNHSAALEKRPETRRPPR